MSENSEYKPEMMKYAKFAVMGSMIMVVGQASTGLSRTYGYDVAGSHAMGAQIGLLLSIIAAVLVVLSKTEDKKVKGMTFGLAFAWFLQYGLGEMFRAGMTWISLIHAVLALGMFSHAVSLMKAMKEDE